MRKKIRKFFWENKWACLVFGAICGSILSAILIYFGNDYRHCFMGVGLACGIVALILRFGV